MFTCLEYCVQFWHLLAFPLTSPKPQNVVKKKNLKYRGRKSYWQFSVREVFILRPTKITNVMKKGVGNIG